MPDNRRTRDEQPDFPLELDQLRSWDPRYTPLDRIGGPGAGGAANETLGLQLANVGDLNNEASWVPQGSGVRVYPRSLAAGTVPNYVNPDDDALKAPGQQLLEGLGKTGRAVGDDLSSLFNAITPSQERVNDIAMRFQNAHAIGNGQLPMYMQMQHAQQQLGQGQELFNMKRMELAKQLQQQQLQKQQKDEDQALSIWKDHQMPIAMKKKLSQQLAAQGNVLAGNLHRLGDEQLVAEMDTLAPFLPKGKMEELGQMMTQPNADLDHVEQWVNFAREKKKIAGEQRMKSERFADLLKQHTTEGLDPNSAEFDEFKQMVLDREKRQNEAAELNLKLKQMGIKLKGEELDLAAKSVMPQYSPEVDLPGGNVQRERFDPQTGQMTTIKGNKPPASVTNVNMKQESAFEAELGKKNVDSIMATKEKASDASMIVRNTHQGRQLLDSGAITGVGAEFFTKFGQALQEIGFTKSKDAVANTQAFAATMAGNVAKQIKEFGAGTGLSDADREYATKMAGGDITLNEQSIRKILDINERAARNIIKNHNKSVKGIKSMIPLEVEEPPEYTKPQKKSSTPQTGPYEDAEKERRYQEWKKRHGK